MLPTAVERGRRQLRTCDRAEHLWTEVYTRCLDGEYFRGSHRARDGYSNPTSIQVAEHVTAVRNDGAVPSLEALADRGFDGELVIVVQFAAPEVGAVGDA